MILPEARFSAVFKAPKAPVLIPTVSALFIIFAVSEVNTPSEILFNETDIFFK
jgi:hypothetical protein